MTAEQLPFNIKKKGNPQRKKCGEAKSLREELNERNIGYLSRHGVQKFMRDKIKYLQKEHPVTKTTQVEHPVLCFLGVLCLMTALGFVFNRSPGIFMILGCLSAALVWMGRTRTATETIMETRPEASWKITTWDEYLHPHKSIIDISNSELPPPPAEVLAIAEKAKQIPHCRLLVHYTDLDPLLEVVQLPPNTPSSSEFIAWWDETDHVC